MSYTWSTIKILCLKFFLFDWSKTPVHTFQFGQFIFTDTFLSKLQDGTLSNGTIHNLHHANLDILIPYPLCHAWCIMPLFQNMPNCRYPSISHRLKGNQSYNYLCNCSWYKQKMSLIKVNSNSIKLTVHPSCYCV